MTFNENHSLMTFKFLGIQDVSTNDSSKSSWHNDKNKGTYKSYIEIRKTYSINAHEGKCDAGSSFLNVLSRVFFVIVCGKICLATKLIYSFH